MAIRQGSSPESGLNSLQQLNNYNLRPPSIRLSKPPALPKPRPPPNKPPNKPPPPNNPPNPPGIPPPVALPPSIPPSKPPPLLLLPLSILASMRGPIMPRAPFNNELLFIPALLSFSPNPRLSKKLCGVFSD